MTRARLLRRWWSVVAAGALLATVAAAAPAAGQEPARAVVDPQVRTALADGGSTGFLVRLTGHAELPAAGGLGSPVAAQQVFDRLTATAATSQADLLATLAGRGIEHQPFWIINAVWVRGDRALVDELANRPEVSGIEADLQWRLPTSPPAVNEVPWGVSDIRADQVWEEFGVTGQGATVATIDTGVEFDHPALVAQYRGNLGGGQFAHDYHWFDPTGVCGNSPCDNVGVGTHATGTMVGDGGPGNQIGVAPGAAWIAAKGCAGVSCSLATLLAAGQWIVAPTDLAGQHPRPDLAPDVVTNSWGGGSGTAALRDMVQAWVAAGILPVFGSGGSGSGCGSVVGPSSWAAAYTVGAYQADHQIAPSSARGPGEAGETKPNITAPGVAIRSAVPGSGYATFSGTFTAAAHAAGAAALVISAGGPVPTLLDQAAIDVADLTCGGTPEKNNVWGEGRLDAYGAVALALQWQPPWRARR